MNTLAMDVPQFVAPLEVTLPDVHPGLVVRPADVGQIARLLAVAGPVVGTLVRLPPGLLDRLTAQEGDEPATADDVADLFELLSEHPDKLLEMVSIATRLEPAVVAGLLPDRYAYLFAVVVQVNADFFSRATPAFAAAGRVLERARAQGLPGHQLQEPGLEPSTA